MLNFWERAKNEFIDIIECKDTSSNVIVSKFDRFNNEIKYGAKLIVRESQTAVFINEGKIADIYQPGTYTLETKNMPIMTTLNSWKYGFESPFKAEVYFVNMVTMSDCKWGTKNPIMLRDAEFGPVRIRAFGTYSIRVKDPATIVRSVSGTSGYFTVDGINDQLRNLIISKFTDTVASSKIPILDLASNYDKLSDFIRTKISPDFESYGFEVANMLIENISLPPNVEEALDKRSSMGIIGNLNAYTQFQAANAIEESAKNPNSGGASAMNMGMALGMANQMSQAFSQNNNVSFQANTQPTVQPPAPPPLVVSSYFLGINGNTEGPHELGKIEALIKVGTVNKSTMVWKQGMENWLPLNQVNELANLLPVAPPPLNTIPTPPPMPHSPPPVPQNNNLYADIPFKAITKGQKLSILNELASESVVVGVNWNDETCNTYNIDISVLMLSERGKIEKEEHFLFYNNLTSSDKAVRIEDDQALPYKLEVVTELEKLSPEISRLVYVITIEDGDKNNQRFDKVKDLNTYIVSYPSHDSGLKYEITDLSKETAVTLIEIYKRNGDWRVQAVGDGFNAGLEAVLKQYASESLNI